jgi:type II secretory pathway component PulF
MALYAYKAMNLNGRTVMGRLEAINLIDLEMRLKRMDLDFINGDTVKQGGLINRAGITRPELINFCFHLEQLARAGVSLIESLTDLRDSIENPRFREIIAGMVESIEGGKTLSQALAEHPQTFDEVMVSLIRAGEEPAFTAAGAQQPAGIAQVAGRTRRAHQETHHVSGLPRHGGGRHHHVHDDLSGAEDGRLHPQHGAGTADPDQDTDRHLRVLRQLLVRRGRSCRSFLRR